MAKWNVAAVPLAAAVAFLVSGSISLSLAATTATVRSTGDYDPNHCVFWGDSVTLVVTQDNRPSVNHNFCSAYGVSKVLQVVKDKRGQTYILLEYGEGHGTRATSKYFEVYSLNHDRLNDRGGELLDEPAAFAFDWVYAHTVVLPPKGGVEVIFKLQKVDPQPLEPWESGAIVVQPALEKIIWIDAQP